jgi:hypothetical protein
MDTVTIISLCLSPITAVAGWFAGRQKRKNDFLQEMQESINLLSKENKQLMAEVISLRRDNLNLHTEIERLTKLMMNYNFQISK